MNAGCHYLLFCMAWVGLHFAASHFYTYHCTPLTIHGLFLSPFQAMTPQCVGCRWVLNNGGNVIAGMWMSLGLHLATIMMRPFQGVKAN
jgi:hypothetical protein